jgi:hypothetical protein
MQRVNCLIADRLDMPFIPYVNRGIKELALQDISHNLVPPQLLVIRSCCDSMLGGCQSLGELADSVSGIKNLSISCTARSHNFLVFSSFLPLESHARAQVSFSMPSGLQSRLYECIEA